MAESALPPAHARNGSLGRALLRRLPLLGTLLGLGLGVWLVATNDLGAIGAAFGRIGWLGLLGIVLVRALIILLCGLAWARILNRLVSVRATAFLVLRFVREGINVLLPVASVGGDVVGGRLLTFWGVSGALAAASILADMLMQVGTQAIFTGLGAVLLRQVEGEAAAALANWILHIVLAASAVVVAFFAFQRFGPVRALERTLSNLSRRFVREAEPADERAATPGASVQDALDAVWGPGRRWRLAQSFGLHLLAWLLGAAEIWIVLSCIGVEGMTLTEILVLESLSQAIKSAAFPIPSGLGVQEGGFVVVGALFGIDAGTAIALSLAKRVPDIALGLPSLLAWQMLEARRTALPAAPRA